MICPIPAEEAGDIPYGRPLDQRAVHQRTHLLSGARDPQLIGADTFLRTELVAALLAAADRAGSAAADELSEPSLQRSAGNVDELLELLDRDALRLLAEDPKNLLSSMGTSRACHGSECGAIP